MGSEGTARTGGTPASTGAVGAEHAGDATSPPGGERRSWTPLVCLFLAQVLMAFNLAALPVSLGGMVADFGAPPTAVSGTIVAYGLVVAALVMTGAKVGARLGWTRVFRVAVAAFGASAVVMVLAPAVGWAVGAQVLAGAAAAVIVPSLVALIAEHYRGAQQATAVGSLGSARALAGVSAFLLGGALGSLVGWRPVFGVVLAVAVAVLVLSGRLRPDRGDPGVRVDVVGAVLVAAAVVLVTLGVQNLRTWGLLLASRHAPFDVLGVSPAPVLVLTGLVLGQAFVAWTRRRAATGRTPLVALSVLGSPRERAAVYAMFVVVALEAALNFTVPLYVQIVQGRSPFDTALAMMPFNLTVLVTATLVVRLYPRFAPRSIGVVAFGLTTVALLWLSLVVTNNWETLPTVLGLVVFGVGQGALVTLVFNVLVTSAPKRQAGDVGAIRGTTQNLASAVGTALAGALLVTVLGATVARAVAAEPALPPALVAQVDLDEVDFVSNADLRTVLERTTATPEQVDAAVALNEAARLDALRLGLLVLAGVSASAVLPASRLPRYRPGEIPDPAGGPDPAT
ncbi:MFS transporter [Cellulomonas triticagri]|uniref:MFS transporter n=1 Tax=Cellulomonas triticagri TaxID=2483352 RepID=A0A3M2JN80_9CELL|nr:MFS transporter [Cellulomonas triticagri]RMI13746.1 MFS transporter [Cellulomonas triticagri]